MNFEGLAFQALNGLASASGLFFVAAGLSLIFGVMRVINMAHGSFYMLGTYLAVTLATGVGGASSAARRSWARSHVRIAPAAVILSMPLLPP